MMYDWQVSFAENKALSVAIGGSGTELGENPAAPAPVLRALCLSHILAQLGQEIAPQGTPATQFGFPTPAMPHRPGTIPCEPTTCLQLGILMVDWGNLGRSTYGPIKQTYAPSSTTRG